MREFVLPIPTIPKSEARVSHNIVVEYAEVPAVEIEGIIGWSLVSGEVTFSEKEAISEAIKINAIIKRNMGAVNDLMASSSSTKTPL